MVKFSVPSMCEHEEGMAVTKISFYVFSNAYIADQYWLGRGTLKSMTQSHFCRTLVLLMFLSSGMETKPTLAGMSVGGY